MHKQMKEKITSVKRVKNYPYPDNFYVAVCAGDPGQCANDDPLF